METDVLIVGAGPCGMALANLLGLYGLETIIIDREADIIDYPRAVGIDDESLRSCQTMGLVDNVLANTLQNTAIRYYTSWGRCFAHVKPSAKPFGWPRRNLFLQPLLEATLRSGLLRFANVKVRLGHEFLGLEQGEGAVNARVRQSDGTITQVRCAYVVGADGGRSSVRGAIGISLMGNTEPVRWLVVDVRNDHLDAPYSAVYCDPISPVLMVPLPYGQRRFEFRLRPGETEQGAVEPDHVRTLLAGLYGATPLPEVIRARVYLHHSRVASTFQVGRVLLVGDAAHLQPPFFGQGMNSGIRDATNLAWKLAAAVRAVAAPGVVASYDIERRPHATVMVEFATKMGARYRPRNRLTERVRDLVFRAVQKLPGGRDYILQMKYKPMPRYTAGVVCGVDSGESNDPVGRMFMQPDVTMNGLRLKLDDALGNWFAVLVVGVDPVDLDHQSVLWWRSIGAMIVRVSPSCSGHPESLATTSGMAADRVIEDVDGAFRDWRLSRPKDEILVLRPDRYVAATCLATTFAATTAALRFSPSFTSS